MKKMDSHGDQNTRSLPGDTCAEARISPEGSSSPDRPAAEPPGASTWTARLKRRWESMLAWLAKGAEHSCPT